METLVFLVFFYLACELACLHSSPGEGKWKGTREEGKEREGNWRERKGMGGNWRGGKGNRGKLGRRERKRRKTWKEEKETEGNWHGGGKGKEQVLSFDIGLTLMFDHFIHRRAVDSCTMLCMLLTQ